MPRFFSPLLSLVTIIFVLTGCASPSPTVPEEFEANYQTSQFEAKAYLIPTAPEAFARRVELVRKAQSTIDMTYFSWNGDTLGLMLVDELKQAADRGVKIRLTLDDLLVFNEKWLADLDAHSNVQVRIFNPFNSRKMGWVGRAADFQMHQDQLDNRLHEKYFNVDNQQLILGGRNIGDEYFGYSKDANFYDMDVLFQGAVIAPFADNYEVIWQSDVVTPIAELISIKQPQEYINLNKAYAKAKKQQPEIIADIEQTIALMPTVEFIDVTVTPVFDSLQKLQNSLPYFRQRAEIAINKEIKTAKKAVISTPYVVPTNGEFVVLDKLTRNGAKVQLITNSSASNDSLFIPAYYEKHRQTLLDMGIELYEYKDEAKNDDHFYHAATYYHNKTIILDDKLSYIGSSNFDPRSDFLNVEFGLFVHSEAFAAKVEDYLFSQKESLYWHVSRNKDGDIEWQSGDEVQDSNPNYGGWHKPIDWIFTKMDGESEL
ncbi:phospholipase D family protein [Shewanella gaetbuli]